LFAVLAATTAESQPAAPATPFVVTTTADSDDGLCDDDCSLREAIQAANTAPGADSITFVLPLSSTIVLSGTQLPVITDTLTLDGSTAASLTVSGNDASRIFEIGSGTAVTISQLTIQNGRASVLDSVAAGGAIFNLGSLTVISGTLRDSLALGLSGVELGESGGDGRGGGVYNGCAPAGCGVLLLSGVSLIANSAAGGDGADGDDTTPGGNGGVAAGGAIYNDCQPSGCGQITILHSAFWQNVTFGGNGGDSSGGFGGHGGHAYGGALFNNDCSQNDCGGIVISDSVIGSGAAFGGDVGFDTCVEGDGHGGAIYNAGVLTVTNTTMPGNYVSSGLSGGCASCYEGESPGGGIYNEGVLDLSGSAIYGSHGDDGGGLSNAAGGMTAINNSTLSGNESKYGGGVMVDAGSVVTLTNVTISDNSANFLCYQVGGGLGGGVANFGGAVYAHNTLIAGNMATWPLVDPGHDCFGDITSAGYNLVEIAAGCTLAGNHTGNITGQSALLAPLQDNGGGTFTHALSFASPALDAGDPLDCPAVDQRGMPRPADGNGDGSAVCDMGAYEGYIPPTDFFYLPLIFTTH
jgi:CSLREA domain-containing protein